MKSHRHHHGRSQSALASDPPPASPSRPIATPAPAVGPIPSRLSRRTSIGTLEQTVTPDASGLLPPEVYLIGCSGAIGPGQPSPQSMGFKAWNLLRMQETALPVPPAFVLGTHYCIDPAARRLATMPALWHGALLALEKATGLSLGNARRPLLLSVRSGAPVSMPGMMETILNIGLCDITVSGLLRQTGNPRLVWDAYRRLVATYGEVVAGLPGSCFTAASTALFGARDERELDFAEMRLLTRRFLEVYAQAANQPFPQTPEEQLGGAIEAVFASWQSAKAREYRRLNQIDDTLGTAVTVQRMVFGNAGGQSGAGVGFTRDPTFGEPALWVDFLFNSQGEDVVSGRRDAHGHDELSEVLPLVWQSLQAAASQLEHAFGDMQDFEFTVQDGHLYMLQTRAGKRTPYACARIALDLLDAGLIDAKVARTRTAGLDRAALAQPRIVAPDGVALAHAATASSGVATGEIALDETRAVARHSAGVPVVLVRRDAETSDITALEAASGLLTEHGARTSHAAVVARQLGKVCLAGCASLQIDETAGCIRIGDRTLQVGDLLTLDGNDGAIYAGAVQTEVEYPEALLARLELLGA
ncbi:MAG: pyruvate, phosphate dikinase [Rhodoferax sp.]|nr:pyruvate, phosphate dikinase [Rhodoferax sp.]